MTAETRLERKPELILHEAVRRMLPKNKLAYKMITKLKIYAGAEHPHQAQQPGAAGTGREVVEREAVESPEAVEL